MAIEGVMRVGQVQLRVMDMDAAVRHYTEYIGPQEVCRDAPIQWDAAELGRAIFYDEGRLNEAFLSVTTSGSTELVAK